LLQRHGALSRTALQAVGYREVIAHLQGQTDLAATVQAVKARTRQFARHQETWFRSLSECRFVHLQEGVSDEAVARQILQTGCRPR
jgi:tRNA dimethylallyltransferase